MKRLGLTMRVDAARERRDALDQAWYPLLLNLGYEPLVVPNLPDAARAAALVAELRLDGVILTGGNDLSHLPGAQGAAPERDAVERALVASCTEKGLPVLGVCRGGQHLISYYGGTLQPVDGHVARPHAIAVLPNPGLPLTNRDAVNSFHNWGALADSLPAVLRAVAVAPDGTVEAFAHRALRHWGIFWHPERDPHDARDADILRALFD